ncbi:DUF305 domain-containing protein [Microbispora sp. SCL1-1]|jgi:uncharacterized protein (DUF305 family)|nr:DUF305 domain-containing protein [Microbispora sp. CL1-1]NJP28040.1 DUF305 domain-containing protein [Microbispora sp. CL1-1]TQS10384.1 DUF305 domain-containing protein [Microbispora sp. SCL1-1]
MSSPRPLLTGLVTVVLAVAPVLAACSSEVAPPAHADAPVIVPGAPGQSGSAPARSPAQAGPVAADVRFAEAMIPHHRQALEMAGLAAARTGDPLVTAVAERVLDAQRPEIAVMESWLRGLGRTAPPAHDHGPGGYGMAGEEELNRLRTARGRDFDTLFLTLMIRHHEGAVTMAAQELRRGRDRAMRTMAQDVLSGQQIEIARMRGIQRRLGQLF